ncbi:MAG: hypothetical protein COT89_03250 [Candidatus Colwellbacteria bacterium CG10_big_fil_rev_8_21_14_0_10_42_22]|uniref:Uncharacterized protein n=1 Tax=Candidatus Colwellbacteria bacterium CG10_big_fil_rev_8_21_14_0_10_42_22 TaxID=1974540 RepID=A0A2H0VF87_9BACT|nr:MAG: hypothetical protein COT89_03250 [Candidatus Colwellbacteria bacterium CG10_big_fil_rev_8_21_14_0_10_42_22]
MNKKLWLIFLAVVILTLILVVNFKTITNGPAEPTVSEVEQGVDQEFFGEDDLGTTPDLDENLEEFAE